MKLIFIFICTMIIFISQCENSEPKIPKTEYDLYNALFESIIKDSDVSIDSIQIGIKDSTSILDAYPLDEDRIKKLEEDWGINLSKELITDFKSKNSSRNLIQNHFFTNLQYQIISTEKVRKIFDDTYGWIVFEKFYPDVTSMITFSRVGFNREGNMALFNSKINCGPHCGSAYYFLFEKSDKQWRLHREYLLYIN